MTHHPQQPTRAYSVSVIFLSDGNVYAQENYAIHAGDEVDAERLGRLQAEDSVYHDARIPDLSLTVTVEEADPTDPEDPIPPAAAAAGVRPICPKCGSDDIIVDASARWDETNQCWSLSGTYDCQTCDACGAEGDDLSIWVLRTLDSPADSFLWAVAAALQRHDVVLDSAFQLFCLNAFGVMTVEQACAEWRSRVPAA